LILLSVKGALPQSLAFVAALYPLHFYWSMRAMREGLSFESVRRLQVRYRLLYAVVGAVMVISVLLN
jgi:hypothetical protein